MDNLSEYLKNVRFEKTLKRLKKKLKNKTVVIYGAGELFIAAKNNYDFSGLNIIAVCDKKFKFEPKEDCFLGYKKILSEQMLELEPDYVLIGTLNYLNIMYSFVNKTFKNTKTKVLPLVEKPFISLLKEIFGR